ncbi:hypothetical protein NL676_003863 [Syzygium grande]|nr:hypothetical protein NL676_003863 [Syzygium grande]
MAGHTLPIMTMDTIREMKMENPGTSQGKHMIIEVSGTITQQMRKYEMFQQKLQQMNGAFNGGSRYSCGRLLLGLLTLPVTSFFPVLLLRLFHLGLQLLSLSFFLFEVWGLRVFAEVRACYEQSPARDSLKINVNCSKLEGWSNPTIVGVGGWSTVFAFVEEERERDELRAVKVEVQTDCTLLVNCLLNGEQSPWDIRAWIEECKSKAGPT